MLDLCDQATLHCVVKVFYVTVKSRCFGNKYSCNALVLRDAN